MKPSPTSITDKLTIWLSVIMAVTLFFAGIATYWSVSLSLHKTAREELGSKLTMILHLVEEENPDGNMENLRHHINDAIVGHGNLLVWLLNEDDEVVYGDPTLMSEDFLMHDFLMRNISGRLLAVSRITFPNAGHLQLRSGVIALDLTPATQLLDSLLYFLLLVGSLAVLLTFSFAHLATRRGLRPLRKLSTQAAAIAPTSFSQRLNVSGIDRELLELAVSFNSVLDRLESSYRQAEAFNADVAHELRTPLAILISGTQLALSVDRPIKHLRETLESNLEELEILKSLVNDMMFLAQADHGTLPTDMKVTCLQTEAHKVCEFYDAPLQDAGVKVIVDGQAYVYCSSKLIRRAMANLLSNAIKFTRQGESIVISLSEQGSCVIIQLINPGLPIPTMTQECMFDRFYQADPTRAQSGDSHGLGLSIVSAIAKMHRGSTFCESGAGLNRIGFRIPR
ncbi:MAG: heavy metal sensor histidine kinase [Gammaproteobacteria bacterium]|nr:heavy metal sensor histidine kinase [Gammaproteobacteria bacterium]MBU0786573.1 heavy metal sensor histidine kinase [Gammaproteobacteria bacterium]MBU0817181.1 heavy metal sensor histidine kinase [Gammaproteobacteria bacterium]MBU1787699.1 heavy metal sensor histidine kinase [Gammaproteobacteria bacterium]